MLKSDLMNKHDSEDVQWSETINTPSDIGSLPLLVKKDTRTEIIDKDKDESELSIEASRLIDDTEKSTRKMIRRVIH